MLVRFVRLYRSLACKDRHHDLEIAVGVLTKLKNVLRARDGRERVCIVFIVVGNP